MAAWRFLILAVLVVAVLMACWITSGWNRRGRWPRPGQYRGRLARRRCGAGRSLLPALRRRRITIRPLPPELRDYYAGAYRSMEAAFQAAPQATLHQVDQLAADVLRHRGYPVETFEHNVTAILPAAPQVVEDYRAAHSIALGNDSGIASEPDLRLALFHYHSLLKTLLADEGPQRLTNPPRR